MKDTARAKDEKKQTNLAEDGVHQGICPSCENLPLCHFLSNTKTPVFFCEEFAANRASARVRKLEVRPAGKEGKAPPNSLKGLCATCEDAGRCIYPKDEAGVWHCEEYR